MSSFDDVVWERVALSDHFARLRRAIASCSRAALQPLKKDSWEHWGHKFGDSDWQHCHNCVLFHEVLHKRQRVKVSCGCAQVNLPGGTPFMVLRGNRTKKGMFDVVAKARAKTTPMPMPKDREGHVGFCVLCHAWRHMKKGFWWNERAMSGKDTASLEPPITQAANTTTGRPITGMLTQSEEGEAVQANMFTMISWSVLELRHQCVNTLQKFLICVEQVCNNGKIITFRSIGGMIFNELIGKGSKLNDPVVTVAAGVEQSFGEFTFAT